MGKYGLNILERDSSFELFGKVGLYYIMFLAALEMDMEGMKKTKSRLLTYGLLTCFIPFGLTYRHERLALGLFHQGFLPAELHHGLQYPDSLPYRFPIWTAAEAERHAECGFQHDFPADSASSCWRVSSPRSPSTTAYSSGYSLQPSLQLTAES